MIQTNAEITGSAFVPNWVMLDKSVSAQAKVLFALLTTLQIGDESPLPPIEDIEQHLGFNPMQPMAELIALGITAASEGVYRIGFHRGELLA